LGLHVFQFGETGKSLSLMHFFWEVGGGIRNVLRTMEFMEPDGIVFGKSFLYAVVYLLPKVLVDGIGVQPGLTRPSVWLAESSGDVPFGGGLGYSFVAETYYNFGMAGCLLFLLAGMFIGIKYYNYRFSGNRYSLLHASFVSVIYSLHMRSDAETYFRYLVYGCVIVEAVRVLNDYFLGIEKERRDAADSVIPGDVF
jgi:hypothetical protein